MFDRELRNISVPVEGKGENITREKGETFGGKDGWGSEFLAIRLFGMNEVEVAEIKVKAAVVVGGSVGKGNVGVIRIILMTDTDRQGSGF